MKSKKQQIAALYYKHHRATILKRTVVYRKNNSAKIRKYQREHRKVFYVRYYSNPKNRLTALYKKAVDRMIKTRGWVCDKRLLYALRANPPEVCACCKRRLEYECGKEDRFLSPSLDRLDNIKGYTLENTRVICFYCNRMKGDATIEGLKKVLAYMQRESKRNRRFRP